MYIIFMDEYGKLIKEVGKDGISFRNGRAFFEDIEGVAYMVNAEDIQEIGEE